MAHTQCGWSSCLVKPHIKVRISNFARGAIQRLRPDLQAGSQAIDENCSPPYCQSKTESYVLSNGQSGLSCLPFPPRGNLSVQKCWVRDCPHTNEERGWSLILILWFPHCHDLTCLYSIHIHSEMCYLFGKTLLLFMDFSLPDNNLRADWSVHSINEYGWSKKSFFKNGCFAKLPLFKKFLKRTFTAKPRSSITDQDSPVCCCHLLVEFQTPLWFSSRVV